MVEKMSKCITLAVIYGSSMAITMIAVGMAMYRIIETVGNIGLAWNHFAMIIMTIGFGAVMVSGVMYRALVVGISNLILIILEKITGQKLR